MLGSDFTIEYKKGKDNRVADAFSRKFEGDSLENYATISLISFPTPDRIMELKQSYLQDLATQTLLTQLQTGDKIPKGYSLQQGLILRKGKIYVVKFSPFKK